VIAAFRVAASRPKRKVRLLTFTVRRGCFRYNTTYTACAYVAETMRPTPVFGIKVAFTDVDASGGGKLGCSGLVCERKGA